MIEMKRFEKLLYSKILMYSNANFLSKILSRKKTVYEEGNKQYLIDISVYYQNDAGTGIQRVVRTIKKILESNTISDPTLTQEFTIKFIYASRKKSYRYLDNHQKISVKSGDIFFGLDWSAHILTANFNEIMKLKNCGVFFSFILYDMLPTTNAEWFTKETAHKHRLWLKLVSVTADQILCISNDVKENLIKYYEDINFNYKDIDIATIPLGSDFENYPDVVKVQQYYNFIRPNQPFALVVGTLEPRKGHIDVLKVFHQLWQESFELNLIFVGKTGWKNQEILQLIKKTSTDYPEQFNFLESINDSELKFIYGCADIVICPSLGEGFGLPVIEAMYFNKTIIARDLPVFKEVSNNQINFFSNNDDLKNLLVNLTKSELIKHNYQSISWQDATHTIVKKIYVTALKKYTKLKILQLDNET